MRKTINDIQNRTLRRFAIVGAVLTYTIVMIPITMLSLVIECSKGIAGEVVEHYEAVVRDFAKDVAKAWRQP